MYYLTHQKLLDTQKHGIFLRENQVHIWQFTTQCESTAFHRLEHYLSLDEVERARRFYFDKDRCRYIIARGVLRQLLSIYVNRSANDIRLAYTDKGKPCLPNSPIQFNLSHSQEWIAIAVTLDHPIGIDIEYVKSKSVDSLSQLAQRFFAGKEYKTWQALPLHQQYLAFFHIWTRKEAFVKALGQGLYFPLDQFIVTVNPERAILENVQGSQIKASDWDLHILNTLEENYVGTVAIKNKQANFLYHSLV